MGKAYKEVIPAGHIQIKENVQHKDNLTGISEKKELWAKDLNLSRAGEYTFFAGCGYQQIRYIEGMVGALKSAGKMGMGMGKVVGISKAFSKVGINLTNVTAKVTVSKDDPYTPVLVNSISILRKLGIEPGYLQDKEPCCGSPMYYAGFEDDYAKNAYKNYKLFKSMNVKKLIGVVPGCTSALKHGYPKYISDYDLEVYHILEIIALQLKQNKIQPCIEEPIKVVYHDPCQLSRYMEITDEPRQILKAIDGVELMEPDEEQIGRWSTCCGGGNIETTHPELSERMGKRRFEELMETGAKVIITNCPACEMQLNHTIKKLKIDVKVFDILSLLDDALN
ncbi:(Fe-S)-binding protein [Desulfotignum balticum]|uniref:(Fe-S)-binding protein n=1 Tax=Desulfotignum balticum TaxID=115781 RepID=UPI000422A9CB|nr:(Fe-S)-binding protein [Desulfotignum balticum]